MHLFCGNCQTYLAGAGVCSTCGQPRPAPRAAPPLWTAALGVSVYGTPVTAGGLLVLLTSQGMPAQGTTLLALDLSAREIRWRCRLENLLVNDPVLVRGDALYAAARSADPLGEGLLLALAAATGDERWRWAPGAQAVSAPAWVDGRLYVTLDDDLLCAVDAAGGAKRWRLRLPLPRSVAAPASSPDVPCRLFLPSRGPHLCAVDLAGRSVVWHTASPEDAGDWFLATPALAGGRLFAASTGGAMLALDAETGDRLWRAVPGQAGKALTAPAADGQCVYVGGRDHCIYALDAASGETLWRYETARRIEGRPLLLAGVLYVAGHDHHLRALDAVTGIELWRVELPRRIEGGPAPSGDPSTGTSRVQSRGSGQALVLAADRGGNVFAVERVLAAEAYAAQARWPEAAAAYARWGDLAAAAGVYEEHLDEPFHAAELWQAADRPDRAAPLYRRAGAEDKAETAYRQASRQATATGDHLKAGESSAAIAAWDEAGELYQQAGRPDLAGPAFERAGLAARAAECYAHAGHWAKAALLYEQVEAWSQAAECHERAGNWEQVGRLQRRLENFEAAAQAFIRAACHVEETAPDERARLAELWAAAEACWREAFDEVQAAVCRRRVAFYRGLPHLEVEVVPPEVVVSGQYALLQFILHNVGGGEAQQVIVHHTPSEFMGELSRTMEVRDLDPGQRLQQFVSVRPLASGPVPLVVAIDYSDEAGNLYETTYRTRVAVLEADELPEEGPAPPTVTAAFADFDLLIDRLSGDVYPVHVVRSPAGEGRGSFHPPCTPQELSEAWLKLENDEADEDWMRDLGARLFGALFAGEVGSRFRNSQGMVSQGKGLRLRLRVGAGELVALPWELLYDPERREFLSLTRRTLVVRHLTVPHPTVARPVSPPLQMLLVSSSPSGLMPLNVEGEVEALQGAIAPLVEAGALALDVLRPATLQALWNRLTDDPPHILHFIGHGGFDGQEGYLALEDAAGRMKRLEARELKVLLSNTPVRLAVLNACLTARDAVRQGAGGLERAYLGLAPALVDAGLLAVVAMQFSLLDDGARVFAQDFYRMLARGRPVDEAVDQARVAMMVALGLERRDWAAPVLFMRGSTGEIFP